MNFVKEGFQVLDLSIVQLKRLKYGQFTRN